MYCDALFLSPTGTSELQVPGEADLQNVWPVHALSVVRSWSDVPQSYGYSGVLTDGYAIVLSLTPTRRRTFVNGQVAFDGWAPPGATRVQRPGERVFTELMTGFDQVAIYVPQGMFQSALKDQYGLGADFDVVDPMWRVDSVIEANLRFAIQTLSHRTPTSFAYLQGLARALVSHVIYWHSASIARTAALRRPESPAMQKAILHIEANLDLPLSLVELAAVAGKQADVFRRDFKNFTGQSPHQYIIKRRVNRACEMLAGPSRPKLSEIALECGFADQSHLSTVFRKILGCSPARYRQ